MHVSNNGICNDYVKNCARDFSLCFKMTGGMFSSTCYTKLELSCDGATQMSFALLWLVTFENVIL